jgi:tetratricopeptide (TPR) repeat protein
MSLLTACCSIRSRMILTAGFLILVVALGWLGWRWRGDTPALPEIDLEGAAPWTVAAIHNQMERVRQSPRSGAEWGLLGQILLAHELPQAALSCFEHAEKFDPANPRWPYLRGKILIASSDWPTALKLLERAGERAAKEDPDNLAPRLQLAESLITLGRSSEAEEQLRLAEKVSAGHPRVAYVKALLAVERQDWPSARALLTPWTVNAPQGAIPRGAVFSLLARVYRALGEKDRAAEAARIVEANSKEMTWPDPYFDESMALNVDKPVISQEISAREARRDYQGANEKLLELIEQGRGQAEEYRAVATNYLLMGDLDQAESWYRKAIAMNPKKGISYHGLSTVYFHRAMRLESSGARPDEVKEAYRKTLAPAQKAVELKPGDANLHAHLADCYRATGQRDKALEALRQAALCRPEVTDHHLRLGALCLEIGKIDEAQQSLDKAAALEGKKAPRIVALQEKLNAARQKK